MPAEGSELILQVEAKNKNTTLTDTQDKITEGCKQSTNHTV
jgi:hypothetical protein